MLGAKCVADMHTPRGLGSASEEGNAGKTNAWQGRRMLNTAPVSAHRRSPRPIIPYLALLPFHACAIAMVFSQVSVHPESIDGSARCPHP